MSLSLIALLGAMSTRSMGQGVQIQQRPASASVFPADAPGSIHGPYRVSGNLILDSTSKPVYLHGVDWPSLDWSCTGQWADASQNGVNPAEFQQMATQWGVNAVRIPVNEGYWLSNSGYYCPSYRTTVASVIAQVESYGMIPIIDLHTAMGGNINATSSPSNPECAPDSGSSTFWSQVASQYSSDPNVMFELYNEPHGIPWQTWRNGGPITCSSSNQSYQTVGMQQLLDVIRHTGATNIAMVDGVDWASNLTQVPRFALSGTNVAYVEHLYVNESSPTTSTSWQNNLGATPGLFPVVATEFGMLGCQTSYPTSEQQAIISYLTSHGIGYTAWGWWVGGCGFPSLIQSESGSCYEGGCPVQQENLALSAGTATALLPVPSSTLNVSGTSGATGPGTFTYALPTAGGGGVVTVNLLVPSSDSGTLASASLSSPQGVIGSSTVKLTAGNYVFAVTELLELGANQITITVPTGVSIASVSEVQGTTGTTTIVNPGASACGAGQAWGAITVTQGSSLDLTPGGSSGYPAAHIVSGTCVAAGLGYASATLYYPGPTGTVSVSPYYVTSSWQFIFGTSVWLKQGWNSFPIYVGGSAPIELGLQINNPLAWTGTLQLPKLHEVA